MTISSKITSFHRLANPSRVANFGRPCKYNKDLDTESELLKVFVVLDIRVHAVPDDFGPIVTKLLAPFAVLLVVAFDSFRLLPGPSAFLFSHTNR